MNLRKILIWLINLNLWGVNMVLFKKDPAMQKLKELTGGLLITSEFEDKLKKAGLTAQDGYEIQQEIKESIKRKDVEVEGVETRINYLIEQRKKAKGSSRTIDMHDETRLKLVSYIDRCEIDFSSKISLKKEVKEGKIKDMDTLISRIDEIKGEAYQKTLAKNKPKSESESPKSEDMPEPSSSTQSQEKLKEEGYEVNVVTPEMLAEMQKEDKIKEMKFLLNQEHNLLRCPNCGEFFLKGDKFCYNCGFDILKFIKDLESGKINIPEESKPIEEQESRSDIKDSKKESKYPSQKSSDSKQKSKITAAEKRAINLKFASVVFLYEKSKNPTKLVKESYYKNRYDVRLPKIKKHVKEEGYLVDGDPLTTARSAKVDDLKKVLKKHDLMVSGTKEELIQRLGENLSEEELKKAFSKKSLKVTDKGIEFIEKNKYVFFYDQITPLRNRIPIEEYDSIFEGVEVSEDKEILSLIDEYLNERGDSLTNIIN